MSRTDPHVLYRIRDDAGTLLYIGVTADIGKRLTMHLDERMPKVARIAGAEQLRERMATVAVEHHANWHEARTAEKAAIRDEAPLLNRHHNPKRWRWEFPANRWVAHSP